jgi:hypothetical protein
MSVAGHGLLGFMFTAIHSGFTYEVFCFFDPEDRRRTFSRSIDKLVLDLHGIKSREAGSHHVPKWLSRTMSWRHGGERRYTSALILYVIWASYQRYRPIATFICSFTRHVSALINHQQMYFLSLKLLPVLILSRYTVPLILLLHCKSFSKRKYSWW